MQFEVNTGPDQPVHLHRLIRPLLTSYKISGYFSVCRQTENVQIRLLGSAVSSGPSHIA